MTSRKGNRSIRWQDVSRFDLVTESEAADLLRVEPQDLESLRSQTPPAGPPFIRIAGSIRYRVEDLKTYVREHIIRPLAETKRQRREH